MDIDAEQMNGIVREAVRAELYAMRHEDNKRAIEREFAISEAFLRNRHHKREA